MVAAVRAAWSGTQLISSEQHHSAVARQLAGEAVRVRLLLSEHVMPSSDNQRLACMK